MLKYYQTEEKTTEMMNLSESKPEKEEGIEQILKSKKLNQ